jgi:hypothetical protein
MMKQIKQQHIRIQFKQDFYLEQNEYIKHKFKMIKRKKKINGNGKKTQQI